MDEIDQSILSRLERNARISMTELGKIVGLSAPAVTERVKRLEEQGVIAGYHTVIAPEKIGKCVTALILVENTNPTQCKTYPDFCNAHPDVIECYRTAGQNDYVTKVVTESVRTLQDFIDEALQYGQTQTLIVLTTPVSGKSLVEMSPSVINII